MLRKVEAVMSSIDQFGLLSLPQACQVQSWPVLQSLAANPR